jgi:hypothetical protein
MGERGEREERREEERRREEGEEGGDRAVPDHSSIRHVHS